MDFLLQHITAISIICFTLSVGTVLLGKTKPKGNKGDITYLLRERKIVDKDLTLQTK